MYTYSSWELLLLTAGVLMSCLPLHTWLHEAVQDYKSEIRSTLKVVERLSWDQLGSRTAAAYQGLVKAGMHSVRQSAALCLAPA